MPLPENITGNRTKQINGGRKKNECKRREKGNWDGSFHERVVVEKRGEKINDSISIHGIILQRRKSRHVIASTRSVHDERASGIAIHHHQLV